MKQILFTLAMLFGLLTVSAQQYDEVDLLGTWKVTSQTGDISNDLKSFEKITLGETMFDEYSMNEYLIRSYPVSSGVIYGYTCLDQKREDGGSWLQEFYWKKNKCFYIDDFLISNQNKLHIISDSRGLHMRFVIKKLTKTEMVLMNYTGTCELILTKEGESRVEAINSDEKVVPEYYSINGIKVDNPDKGLYIKKEGRKTEKILK